MFDKCACPGCRNQIGNIEKSPYCSKCEKNLVFMEESGVDTGLVYCKLHESPPLEEEKIEYLIISKAYIKK